MPEWLPEWLLYTTRPEVLLGNGLLVGGYFLGLLLTARYIYEGRLHRKDGFTFMVLEWFERYAPWLVPPMVLLIVIAWPAYLLVMAFTYMLAVLWLLLIAATVRR